MKAKCWTQEFAVVVLLIFFSNILTGVPPTNYHTTILTYLNIKGVTIILKINSTFYIIQIFNIF